MRSTPTACQSTHLPLREQAVSAFQWCRSLNCPHDQVRYGVSRRIWTCSPFCNGKRNDSPQANPHLYGVAPTKKALSKQITQPPQVLPIKKMFPAGPKWWICTSGGSVASLSKANSITTGMRALKTGLTTKPNTTWTPTMKPTKVLMQAYGTR